MSDRRTEILHTSEPGFSRWQEVYDRIKDKGVYHSPDYIRFLEKFYGDEAELFLYGNDTDFIYYPYFKRRLDKLWPEKDLGETISSSFDIISSWYYGGPLVSSTKAGELFDEFLEELSAFAKNSNYVSEFIRFDANLENHRFYPYSEVTENRETVFVDLTRSDSDIWDDFTSANQRAIKKAASSDFELKVVTDPTHEYWHRFFEIYTGEMQRKNAPLHLCFPWTFFKDLGQALKDNSILLIAERGNEVCGGFMVVFDKDSAFHYLSASLPVFWPERVNNFLFYQAVLWAKGKGFSILDFMGGRPGVFEFKANFSSARKRFYIYKKIHDKHTYTFLEDIRLKNAGADTATSDQFFPAYRAPLSGR